MKMAKLQKATLDPTKISGRCGRLKCCLRYEYDTYEEHRKEMPPVGATVVTKQGTGKVIGQELLAQKLMIQYEGQRQVMTDAKDVLTVVSTKSAKSTSPASEKHSDGRGENDQSNESRPRRDTKPRHDSRPNPRPRTEKGPDEFGDRLDADVPDGGGTPESDLE